MSMTQEQLTELIQKAGLEGQFMTGKARRQIPRMPAMVPRGTVIFYIVISSMLSFGLGGMKVAYHYSDEIHAGTTANPTPIVAEKTSSLGG